MIGLKKVLLCLILALCCRTPANALELSAHSAVLLDGDSGQVLFAQKADEKSLIASTTKIMTALVVLEHAELSEVVEIPAEAVGIEGSSMYLRAGERLTVEDLLHGLMLSSGNDAAVALALHVAGSVDAFAELMNEKAGELGLTQTSFENPHGLDGENHYSTARELGIIASAAMEREDFQTIVSTKTYRCGDRILSNHNKLLWRYDGALGVKTGFTKKAGRILVGAAQRNGRKLITVTINAPNDWQDHEKLFDYGFSQYVCCALVEEGTVLGAVPVIGGQRSIVELIASQGIDSYVLPEEETEIILNIPEFIYAPVEAGQRIGTAQVLLAGRKMGEVELIASKSVLQSSAKPGFWEKIRKHLGVSVRLLHIRPKGGQTCRNACKRFYHPAELHHEEKLRS